MKRASIRDLKHDTSTVLSWVAQGESVEVRRRNVPVAVLRPPLSPPEIRRPDFAARLERIYGGKVLEQTATELISEQRGDR